MRKAVVATTCVMLLGLGGALTRADTAVAFEESSLSSRPVAKPLSEYTGSEFLALTRRTRFGAGVTRTRPCREAIGCDGTNPSRSTTVRVDAALRTAPIDLAAVPAEGVIVARMVNLGSATESMYRLRASRKLEYYVIATPGTGGAANVRFEELDTSTKTVRTIGVGFLTSCAHPTRKAAGIQADFKSCADAHNLLPASRADAEGGLLDPVWVGCGPGCCVAELTQWSPAPS